MLSPEQTGNYHCPACDNRRFFYGLDLYGYGGPESCTASCEMHGEPCSCTTLLEQHFEVLESGDIDYQPHIGGSWGAEISAYTEIYCEPCGHLIWSTAHTDLPTDYPPG